MATRGRKPRKPKNPGGPVKVRAAARSPRGRNKGKPGVRVRNYRRGRPKRRRR